MADELIRLDTTIIGIDSLINKALTAEEAKVLFTVKDVIYSQQRYFTDVQPIVYAHKTINVGRRSYCSNCGKLAIMEDYCSKCGAKVKDGDTNGLS
jgi:hypothetical protein